MSVERVQENNASLMREGDTILIEPIFPATQGLIPSSEPLRAGDIVCSPGGSRRMVLDLKTGLCEKDGRRIYSSIAPFGILPRGTVILRQEDEFLFDIDDVHYIVRPRRRLCV